MVTKRINRRDFMKSASLVAGGMFVPGIFREAVQAQRLDRPYSTTSGNDEVLNKTLIIIQQAGGNDGLNTIIPYQNGTYYDARPSLAIPGEEVIGLNGDFALHPALTNLQQYWDSGKMAVIGNVGYDEPSLSHFQSMDIWHKADPAQGRHDGWLSTLVSGSVDADGHPLGGISMGSTLTPTLCCPPTPPPSISNLDQFELLPDPRFPGGQEARFQALTQLYDTYQSPAPYAALFDSNADAALESSELLQAVALNHEPVKPFPETPFGQGLQLLSAAIIEEIGLRIGYIVLGGFDTHATQLNTHANLLTQLAEGVDALLADLEGAEKSDDVVVMTWSEFGRRVYENGSDGTDHGTAAPQLIFGGAIEGGMYGDLPDLGDLDENGNLKYSIDFRSMYATMLDGWFQADHDQILGGTFDTIPIFK